MQQIGYYNRNDLLRVASHKCRSKIGYESQEQNGCTGRSVQYRGTVMPTNQHVVYPVCTNEASVNEPCQDGHYTLRVHMDTHIHTYIYNRINVTPDRGTNVSWYHGSSLLLVWGKC